MTCKAGDLAQTLNRGMPSSVRWETAVENWIERMADQNREDALEALDWRVRTTARMLSLMAGRSVEDLCPPETTQGDTVKLLLMNSKVVVDSSGKTVDGFLQVTTKRGSRSHFLHVLDESLPDKIEALYPRRRVDLSKKHHWVSCYRNRDMFLTFCLLFRLSNPWNDSVKELSPLVKRCGDLWSVRFCEGEGYPSNPPSFYHCWTTSETLGELYDRAAALALKEPATHKLQLPALAPKTAHG